jgi:hypothetical protein
VIATASPCILAGIPLVIGFAGSFAGGNKKQAFLYSLTFLVGLAVVMSILSAMASLMGTMFGDVGALRPAPQPGPIAWPGPWRKRLILRPSARPVLQSGRGFRVYL